MIKCVFSETIASKRDHRAVRDEDDEEEEEEGEYTPQRKKVLDEDESSSSDEENSDSEENPLSPGNQFLKHLYEETNLFRYWKKTFKNDLDKIRRYCVHKRVQDRMNEVVFNVLFRGVQVGFINALRHGNAGHIRLSFWVSDDSLRMRIWNDTAISAADSAVITEGIGLRGMYERLETVGGALRFGTVADGFEFVISIPKDELNRATD